MDERTAALGSLRTVALVAAIGVSLHPALGSAQALEARVVLPDCPGGYGGLTLRRLLILELSDAGLSSLEVRTQTDALEREAAVTVRLEADCEDDGRVAMSVTGGPHEPQVRQSLDLSEIDARARPRAVAVAVAEQVRLQRLLAEQTPEPEPPPEPGPPLPARPPPPTVRSEVDVERPPALQPPEVDAPDETPALSGALTLAFEARGFPQYATWPVGARVGAWVEVFDLIRVSFDLGPAFTAAEFDVGRVETWLVTVGFGVAARWSVTDEVGILPGARVDLGYVSLSGFDGVGLTGRGEGLSVALLGSLAFDFAIGPRVGVLLELDVGATVISRVAVVLDEELAGTEGIALGLRAGFRFGL